MVTTSGTPPTRLARLAGSLLVGNLAYLASQFGMFVILAQLAPVESVGAFAWAMAVTSPVFTLADMRLQQIQLTDQTGRWSFPQFMRHRLISLAAAYLVLIVPLWLAPDLDTVRVLCAAALFKSLEGVLSLLYGEHLRHERMVFVGRLQIARGAGTLAAFGLTMALTGDVAISLLGSSASLLGPIWVASRGSRSREARSPVAWRTTYMQLTRVALPLGLGFFIGSLSMNFPRYVIEAQLGLKALAIFSAVSYVIVLTNTVIDTLAQSAMPRLSRSAARGHTRAFTRLTNRMVLASMGLGLVTAALTLPIGPTALRFLFGPEYVGGARLLVLLLLVATLQYGASVMRAACIAGGVRGVVLPISAGVFVAVATGSLTLIPLFGVDGVVYALGVGQLLSLTSYFLVYRRTANRLGHRANIGPTPIGEEVA